MKKNLPFILIIAVFFAACAIITAITVRDEPGYVRVVHVEPTAAETSSETERININTASSEQLQSLPGIGEVIAARIIAYREESGDFLNIEEIMDVSGIGEKMFGNIKEFICVD
ncbi:MAG: ComEA family DNA-binding protein [Oscillospiraceae bacterium]|jgi:competence protein ComEA|nr:ComEA family DNA-binding protein [Oscillospiraceae bacterium]